MKILVITREFPPHILGGISYHVRDLYTRVVEQGHDVTVLAGRCGDATYTQPEVPSVDFDVRWVDYPTVRAHHLQFPLVAKRALEKIEQSQFDVAITHTPLPFSLDIPTISKYHDCTQEERPYIRKQMSPLVRVLDSALNPTRRFVDERSLKASDHLIFNSELTHDAWAKHYRVETDYDVIYNGVDTATFYPRETESEDDFLLFVGDSERKGLSTILRSASELELPIYVVGPADVEVAGVTAVGRVSQSELANYYSRATATIHPAEFEAFGNVVLESLACGTPVIVSECCGASEIIDESCGVVTADVSRALSEIREMDSSDCVRKARDYTWERVAERTIRLAREAAI